jgi:hypothetical protein
VVRYEAHTLVAAPQGNHPERRPNRTLA